MNLQVALPKLKPCVFNCPFCVVNTHTEFKGDVLGAKNFAEILKGTEKGFDRLVITGENEPLQNLDYLVSILITCKKPIELTTRGYLLKSFIRRHPQLIEIIDNINLSISETEKQTYTKSFVNALEIAKLLKDYKTKVRFTFLETKKLSPHMVRQAINSEFIDEITIKKLQGSIAYVKENKTTFVSKTIYREFKNNPLARYDKNKRFIKMTMNNKPVWIDTDCQTGADNYLIFRPDGKLYNSWESTKPIGG